MIPVLTDSIARRITALPGVTYVALSRAKESVVVIANLTFLEQKLPANAKLRTVLYDFQRAGRILDVREVLALRPVFDDLK